MSDISKIDINRIEGLSTALEPLKSIGYEERRLINCNGATTVSLQDSDEIVALVINEDSTITFDLTSLTFPKSSFTIQTYYTFPNGVKTVTFGNTGIKYINGLIPDFSSGKNHWVVCRFVNGLDWLLMSDAGEES